MTITLAINGKDVSANNGASVLDAINQFATHFHCLEMTGIEVLGRPRMWTAG